MDYKYIEQLLERYWEGQTTLEEESILHAFFSQADIPASLLPLRDLFMAEENMKQESLSEDFDERIMARLQGMEGKNAAKGSVPPARITFIQTLRPLYRAAAVVAIVLTIGMAAQQGFQRPEADTEPAVQLSANTMPDTINLFTETGRPAGATLAVREMPEELGSTEAVARPISSQADTLQVLTP